MRGLSLRLVMAGLIAVSAAAVAGCGSTDTPTTPTPPVETVTDTFTGTLTLNGAATFPFIAATAGTVTATLTAAEPAVPIGLSLGTFNGLVCTLVKANDVAVVGASVTGSITSASSLCVRVADAQGTLTDPVAFTVTIVHP